MTGTWKPSRAEVEAARGGGVPDLLGPGLDVLFCGINPSLYSAAVGYHFDRPGRLVPLVTTAGTVPLSRIYPRSTSDCQISCGKLDL
jgi:TDG/mug DNA glycosylase family protein